MRSRLLLPVPHLPTIRETCEELSHGAPGQEEPPNSPSLDDYVRSICQLAQPTSVLDKIRSRPHRPYRPAWTREKRCQAKSVADSSPCFSSLQPPLPSPGTDNPLDWLFGKSQEQQADRRDLPNGPDSSDYLGVHRQMEENRGRLCEARLPENSPGRKSGHRQQTSDRKSWTSRKSHQALAAVSGSRPSSILSTLCLHLPVIHEL
ncbi:protein DEPP1 [Cricetulus griseus]|uniref:Protein DEPP1 n=1 Tax=Cricetulus griseus TaxID=10029 RepID=A0A9J7JYS0_CRIGR|nr:protein DEPP1 [Cricetulus griseus]XP_027285024.1 protein DEPP1 [Cricetulus griseus]ERE67194.1 protein DEPP-like protein [Cricetulus griseus]